MENRRAGFTLLEVSVYITIVLILGAPLTSIFLVSTRSTQDNDTFNKVKERNRTALFRVETEFRKSIGGTATIIDYGRGLTFTSTAGFDGTTAIPGPTISYTFQMDPAEAWDGMDNNGNGLADEGRLVRRNATTGEEVVICSQINVSNSGFWLMSEGLYIWLTSFAPLSQGGVYSVSRYMTIYPRN